MLKICIEIHNDNNIMTEKELNSLCSQLRHSYAENKKGDHNNRLIIAKYEQIKNNIQDDHLFWPVIYMNGYILDYLYTNKNLLLQDPKRMEDVLDFELNTLVNRKPELKPDLNSIENENIATSIEFEATKKNLLEKESVLKSIHDNKNYACSTGKSIPVATKMQPTVIKYDNKFINNICVYLSSDAEEELLDLSTDKIYIIGGLVDRNRYKNYIHEFSKRNNIKCCKLPIDRYVKMISAKVLTVNQVYSILSDFYENKDWKSAFERNIPSRKMDK